MQIGLRQAAMQIGLRKPIRALLRSARITLWVWPLLGAQAQSVPDSGRLLEDLRPPPQLIERSAPQLGTEPSSTEDEAAGERVQVERFRINGATQFSNAQLHALVADGEGRALTLGELQRLVGRITRHYHAQGYFLTRAYLPAQEIKDGEIQIEVLEGRIGKIETTNTADIGGMALSPLSRLQTDEAAQGQALQTTLLLLSDLPGVDVQSTLRPGTTPGTSDLLVNVAPGRPMDARIEADNFGDRFSGRYRIGGALNLNNPLHLGDQLSLRLLTTGNNLNYLRASYQLPINRWGTRAGVAASQVRYRLGDTAQPLDATGTANVGSIYLLHPLLRSQILNINAELQFDHKKLQDRIGATSTLTDRTVRNASLGISGDLQDGLGGGAANAFTLAYTRGSLTLDPASFALDAATAGSSGNFSKLNLSWLRLQSVQGAFSLYLSGVAQIASKNLASSEKISLGGSGGVRAYPQGEASGDEGYVVTVEGRYRLPLSLDGLWQAVAFFDHGRVRIDRNPWQAGANSRRLSGAGLGLNALLTNGWSARLNLAWKTGHEMPLTDSDRSPRFWAQASKSF